VAVENRRKTFVSILPARLVFAGASTNGNASCEQLRGGEGVIETPISRLEGESDKLEGIRFIDGNFLPRSALFFSPGQYQRSHLAEQLGCEFGEDTNCIQCGENAATNIPGVYAAGNASRGVQLVIAAAAEGMQAAFAINNALLDADVASNALRDREPGQPTPPDRITSGNEAVN
jgi:thioredoxin reductase